MIIWDLDTHPISTLFIENYHNSESMTFLQCWEGSFGNVIYPIENVLSSVTFSVT